MTTTTQNADDHHLAAAQFITRAADNPKAVTLKHVLVEPPSTELVTALTAAATKVANTQVFVGPSISEDTQRKLLAASATLVAPNPALPQITPITLYTCLAGGAASRHALIGTTEFETSGGFRHDISDEICSEIGDVLALWAQTATQRVGVDGAWVPAGRKRVKTVDVMDHLLLGGLNLRAELLGYVEAEAGRGEAGRIRLRSQSLDDEDLIGALNKARSAGVDVSVLVPHERTLATVSDTITLRCNTDVEQTDSWLQIGDRQWLATAPWTANALDAPHTVLIPLTTTAVKGTHAADFDKLWSYKD